MKVENENEIKQALLDTELKNVDLFYTYLNLVLNIRYRIKADKDDENDVIQSPVSPFFDSRKHDKFINNGDSNGAYNIARKGLCVLKKLPYLNRMREILKESGIENPALNKKEISETFARVKDQKAQKEITSLIEQWWKDERKERTPFKFSENLFKKDDEQKKSLSEHEQSFMDYISTGLFISKEEWANYVQQEEIVEQQKRFLR